MSSKFLGKVIAGAALGCASLLISAPAFAYADEVKEDVKKIEICKVLKEDKKHDKKHDKKWKHKKIEPLALETATTPPVDGYGKKPKPAPEPEETVTTPPVDGNGETPEPDETVTTPPNGEDGKQWEVKKVIKFKKECKLIILEADGVNASDSDGESDSASASDGESDQVLPEGAANAGDGGAGASTADSALVAAGAGMLGAAAAGGTALLRRRSAGRPVA